MHWNCLVDERGVWRVLHLISLEHRTNSKKARLLFSFHIYIFVLIHFLPHYLHPFPISSTESQMTREASEGRFAKLPRFMSLLDVQRALCFYECVCRGASTSSETFISTGRNRERVYKEGVCKQRCCTIYMYIHIGCQR